MGTVLILFKSDQINLEIYANFFFIYNFWNLIWARLTVNKRNQ
jgi:hypothetical protein